MEKVFEFLFLLFTRKYRLQFRIDRQITIDQRQVWLHRLFEFHILIHTNKIGGNHSTAFYKRFTAIVTLDTEVSQYSS